MSTIPKATVAAVKRQSKLASALAHNDPKMRTQGVRALRRWLVGHPRITAPDMSKLWKAVFYCFWMSDKRHVQQELAARLAEMLHDLPDARFLLFLRVFFETMRREWTNIDRLRMDKFMSLVRLFVRNAFVALDKRQWAVPLVAQVATIFAEEPLACVLPQHRDRRGICLHVLDVYTTELVGVCTLNVPFAAIDTLLAPLYRVISRCPDVSIAQRAVAECFEPLYALMVAQHMQAQAREEDEEEDAEAEAALWPKSLHVAHDEGVLQAAAQCFQVHVAELASRVFMLSGSPDTLNKLRDTLYEFHDALSQIAAEMAEDPEDMGDLEGPVPPSGVDIVALLLDNLVYVEETEMDADMDDMEAAMNSDEEEAAVDNGVRSGALPTEQPIGQDEQGLKKKKKKKKKTTHKEKKKGQKRAAPASEEAAPTSKRRRVNGALTDPSNRRSEAQHVAREKRRVSFSESSSQVAHFDGRLPPASISKLTRKPIEEFNPEPVPSSQSERDAMMVGVDMDWLRASVQRVLEQKQAAGEGERQQKAEGKRQPRARRGRRGRGGARRGRGRGRRR